MTVHVRDEMQLQTGLGIGLQRTDHHRRAEIGAANADVHDIADAAARLITNALRECQHCIKRLLHLLAVRALAGRRTQRRMQHRAAFGDVDRGTVEKRLAL